MSTVTPLPRLAEFSLRNVDAPAARDLWPWVRHGLEAIVAKGDERCPWIPEDIYMALMAGTQRLHVVLRGGKPVAFFTAMPVRVDYEPPVLHLYTGWADPELGDGAQEWVMQTAAPQLAAELGLSGVQLTTVRTGWVRALRDTGWKMKGFTMHLEVPRDR